MCTERDYSSFKPKKRSTLIKHRNTMEFRVIKGVKLMLLSSLFHLLPSQATVTAQQ